MSGIRCRVPGTLLPTPGTRHLTPDSHGEANVSESIEVDGGLALRRGCGVAVHTPSADQPSGRSGQDDSGARACYARSRWHTGPLLQRLPHESDALALVQPNSSRLLESRWRRKRRARPHEPVGLGAVQPQRAGESIEAYLQGGQGRHNAAPVISLDARRRQALNGGCENSMRLGEQASAKLKMQN